MKQTEGSRADRESNEEATAARPAGDSGHLGRVTEVEGRGGEWRESAHTAKEEPAGPEGTRDAARQPRVESRAPGFGGFHRGSEASIGHRSVTKVSSLPHAASLCTAVL